MKTLFKVINQSDPIQITKQDGSLTNKCSIVLQEIGGKYENTYVASLYGQPTPNREQSSSLELPRYEGGKDAKQINAAVCKFYPNDYVWASLRFCSNEYQGRSYMEATVQDIISFSHH